MFAGNLFERLTRARFGFCAVAALFIASAQSNFAQKLQPPVFPTAEAAVDTLYNTVQIKNESYLKQLIGKLASSGDPAEDNADRELFLRKYQEMHRLVRQPDGIIVLYIGAENWPFPIPLIPKDGKWHFDVEAGTKEVMFRKIGENENRVIQVCEALGFITHPGDITTENDPAKEFAHKLLEQSEQPVNGFYGYIFRKSTKDGWFVAYPARYGSTGIMTFVFSKDGAVYEKDLGHRTPSIAKGVAQFKPDQSWHLTEH